MKEMYVEVIALQTLLDHAYLPKDEVRTAFPVALHQPLGGGDDVVPDVFRGAGEHLSEKAVAHVHIHIYTLE